jgi:SulP family sulfate permease
MNIRNVSGDLIGGFIAATIALPQALAFGTMTGAGALSGLYGAMFLCLFSGLFGINVPLISGPTGPTAIIIASIYAGLGGNVSALWAVLFLASVFQIVLSFTKIPNLVKYVPYPVISGFMNGVGVILIILQIAPLMGVKTFATPILTFKNLSHILSNINTDALVIGLFSLGILIYTPKIIKKYIPSEIFALIFGTLAAWAYKMDVPTIAGLTGSLPNIVTADFSNIVRISTLAVMVAVICSTESLMTGLVITSLTKKKINNQTLIFAQGIGNSIASLFGGISGAGATMRSVAAIKTGATTKLSTIFCGIIILFAILYGNELVNMVPMATLAAILIRVGYNIIDTKLLKVLHCAPKEDLTVMFLVFFLTIFHDIIFAVGVGITLSAALFAKQLADKTTLNIKDVEDNEIIRLEKRLHDESDYKIRVVHIRGEFFFGSATQIISQFEELLGTKHIILCYDSDRKLDISAIFALEDILIRLKSQGVRVYLVLRNVEILKQINELNIQRQLNDDEIFFEEIDAIQKAKEEFRNYIKLENNQTANKKRRFLFHFKK